MAPSTARPADDPALLTAQLLLRIGFGIVAIAMPVAAAFSRRSAFVLLPFGGGLIVIAALLLSPHVAVRRFGAWVRSPLGIAALFLAAWAALSLIWTPYHHDAVQRLFKTALTVVFTVAACACLPERMRLSSLYLIPIGVAAAAAITIVGGLTGALSGPTDVDLFTLKRAVVTLVVLVWPALAALVGRGRVVGAAALAAAAVAAAIAARSPVALVALGVGGLAYAAARFDTRRSAARLALVGALLVFFAPALPFMIRGSVTTVAGGLPDWLQPVGAWAEIVYSHRVRLVTGHGLETVVHGVANGTLPLETPRSLLFYIWHELGLLGGATAAFLVGRAFVSAGRVGAAAPYLLAELASAFVFSIGGHDPAQLWWVTLLGVAAICFAGVINGQYRTSRPSARPVIELAAHPTA